MEEAPMRGLVEQSTKGGRVGSASFWTLLHFGRSRGVVGLRDVVEQRQSDGQLTYVALTDGDQPGDGFGQFCKLTSEAEERLLTHYRTTANVRGKANSKGVSMSGVKDVMPFLAPLLFAEHESSTLELGAGRPVLSDSDVVGFEDVKSFRMPLGVENNFKIHVCPLKPQEELHEQVQHHNIKQMKGLSHGLPSSCDVFRDAAFTGRFHGLGIVPAIDSQQFLLGSACQDAGYTWVRFDKGDLASYDHDLQGIPMLEDEQAVIFPTTHLWVDFDFPTAAYALEWFCGTRCLVRRELSLWPMPNFLFQKIISITLGNLRDVPERR